LRVLVTGASGFMAHSLLKKLADDDNIQIVTLSRKNELPELLDLNNANTCFSTANFFAHLDGVDVVVHIAARAHILKETAANPLDEYRKVNVDFTMNLARQALECQVKRFIYISSIGVHGVTSQEPFSTMDELAPQEPYSVSKAEAEKGLQRLCQCGEMDLVIIRPPLTYGPDAPGNFSLMVQWLQRGVPLPLGAVDNLRSLISVDNLVDLIHVCLEHPAAADQVLLACDGEDVSTPELLHRLGRAMGRPARLVKVPPAFLLFGAALIGKRAMAQRLIGSLQVDMTATTTLLGWTPPITLDEGLARCFETDKARR